MEEYKCAFNATLMGGQFGCIHARRVTRRGGPDVVCAAGAGHERCRRLFGLLKTSALPAFGVEDDLLSMPHSKSNSADCSGFNGCLGAAVKPRTHLLIRQNERAKRAGIPFRRAALGSVPSLKP